MLTRFTLAFLVLSGCPSTAYHSAVVKGLWQQVSFTLNSHAICLDAPELLRCGEQIASMLIDQAVAGGYAKDRAEALELWTRPGLCLIPSPEPCCLGDLCAGGNPAPRAACTVDISTWLSREWPAGTRYDYSPTVETELRTSLGQRLGIPTTARHDSAWDLGPRTGVKCDWRM